MINKWYYDRLFVKAARNWMLNTSYEYKGRVYGRHQAIGALSLCGTMGKQEFMNRLLKPTATKLMALDL